MTINYRRENTSLVAHELTPLDIVDELGVSRASIDLMKAVKSAQQIIARVPWEASYSNYSAAGRL
jgi:hypothetical protein